MIEKINAQIEAIEKIVDIRQSALSVRAAELLALHKLKEFYKAKPTTKRSKKDVRD